MSLPRSVRDVVDLVGFPAAMALVKAFGGTCVNKVPVHGSGRGGAIRDRLIELMGKEAAEKFIKTYSGERFAVARCEAALRAARDTEIIAKYDSDISAATLAIEYGMTERNVRNILKRVPDCTAGVA